MDLLQDSLGRQKNMFIDATVFKLRVEEKTMDNIDHIDGLRYFDYQRSQ